MNEKLSQTIDTLSLMPQLSSQPMAVELYDTDLQVVYADSSDDGINYVSAGKFAGEDSDVIKKTISMQHSQRSVDNEIESSYVPVCDMGTCVGCIVTRVKKQSNEKATEKAEVFMECIDKINNAIDRMSIHFENLFDKLQAMKEKTGFISEGVEETSVVVSKIRANASKSKILALNASIEAARSGEAGRGFTVVAKEMGEMATASGTSASDINDALQSIFGHLEEITTSITDANELAEKQTSSINEIEEYLGAALNAAMELGQALQE